MKNLILRKAPPIVWALLIYLGSSLPSAQVSQNGFLDFLAHKLVHLFEYSVLYLLFYWSLIDDFWGLNGKAVLISIGFVTFYGGFDEYHQTLIPGRNGRYQDVFVDFLGGLLGLVLWFFLRQRKQQKLKN